MNYKEYTAYVSEAINYDSFTEFFGDVLIELNLNLESYMKVMGTIFNVAHGKIANLVTESKLTMKDFGAKFDIPYSTVQKWRYGLATAPTYLVRLIGYVMILELIISETEE